MKKTTCYSAKLLFSVLAFLLLPVIASAAPVALETDAYATFCQNSFNISSAVDGSFSSGVNGWAIDPQEGSDNTAVFKTVSDIQNTSGGDLAFSFHSLHSNSQHNLGKFRIAVTNSARGTFGVGVECGNADPEGSATWTVLHPGSATSANGQTLTIQGDGSILASGTNPSTDVVTVMAQTPVTNITGIRLEVLTDNSLPFGGPGREPINGNFVLTEMEVDAIAGESVATFEVSKFFNDGNENDVEVHINCNTGLPLRQSKMINQDDGVTFVVTSFTNGELDCRVWESDVSAYSVYYNDDCETGGSCSNDETACLFSSFSGGDAGYCVVENSLQKVQVDVSKIWFDEQHQIDYELNAAANWYCNNTATFNATSTHESARSIRLCKADECGSLYFSGVKDTQSFRVYPDWESGTSCYLEERIFDSSVESDASDCAGLTLWPGSGASCTIENTRFYEGIPTLSPNGLAILTLLMMAVAVVGFRRIV